MTILWLLTGCYRLDGFFFNPEATDAYALGGDVIPSDCQELVSFEGEAGTLYGAWAHQAHEGDTECVPTERNTARDVVVYFHGNSANIDEYWTDVAFYWESGYEVFIFDYRGYGRSAGEPDFDGVIADGVSAIAMVEETTELPSTDLVYIGLSLGGFVAVHNLVATPPRVLITQDMFATTQKMLDDGTTLDLPSGWFFEENFDNVAAVRAMPPEVPYLVSHGADDTYIQPEHAQMIFKGAAATTKKLLLNPGADHAETIEKSADTFRPWVECWIRQDCAAE